MVQDLKGLSDRDHRALGSGSVWDSLQMFNMETFSYDVTANDLGDLWGDSDLDQFGYTSDGWQALLVFPRRRLAEFRVIWLTVQVRCSGLEVEVTECPVNTLFLKSSSHQTSKNILILLIIIQLISTLRCSNSSGRHSGGSDQTSLDW
ncbi:hypothetical protein J6590_051956 [Homalodisca vitripennis]|nr:hypothetical protein J6590_051956 [Homalodisca vitripennis]